jgi:hypothetical protein
MKKVKSTEIIFGKKIMSGNTIAIHNVLKKKNYKTKFSTSSILKKKQIDKDNSEKKKKTILEKKKKKNEKKTCGES